MSEQIVKIDGIKWWIVDRVPTPLCPEHNLRLHPVAPRLRHYGGRVRRGSTLDAMKLVCAEGPHFFNIPRKFSEEEQYVIDRIDAKVFANMPILNLDDEAIPITKKKVRSKDSKYFLTAHLMESKRGIQVVIYAGEKGRAGKTQVFIEPEIKRLAFDQKDLHPTEIFSEIKATFDDGSKQMMKGARKK